MPSASPTSLVGRLRKRANVLAVIPSGLLLLIFVYGFVLWSFVISLTDSTLAPRYNFVGLAQYVSLWSNERWIESVGNLVAFTLVFVGLSTTFGLLQAILIDQQIRAENAIRTIYLYPMAISFIVTGTAWKWMLNPGLGFEKLVREMGFPGFQFDWIINPQFSVYTLAIAAIWQSSGFAMAMFLASLRSIDGEIIKAARIDGASSFQIYRSIVLPLLRPALFTSVIVLMSLALRTFDLMVAMTGGGPGFSSDLPTNFFYQFAFGRSRLGFATASSMMIFLAALVLMVPFIIWELRNERHRGE